MLNVSFFNFSQVNTVLLIKRANDKLKKLFLLGNWAKIRTSFCLSLNNGVFSNGLGSVLTTDHFSTDVVRIKQVRSNHRWKPSSPNNWFKNDIERFYSTNDFFLRHFGAASFTYLVNKTKIFNLYFEHKYL